MITNPLALLLNRRARRAYARVGYQCIRLVWLGLCAYLYLCYLVMVVLWNLVAGLAHWDSQNKQALRRAQRSVNRADEFSRISSKGALIAYAEKQGKRIEKTTRNGKNGYWNIGDPASPVYLGHNIPEALKNL